jgi:hypothetical protein
MQVRIRASATHEWFYNTSSMDLKAIVGDQDSAAINLAAYLHGFSPNAKAKASTRSDQTESSLQSP